MALLEQNNVTSTYDSSVGSGLSPIPSSSPALRDCVAHAVRRYLHDLGDCESHELYDIVLGEIERPLLTEIMHHYSDNQSRAAAILGINRATLRKKLRQYNLG